MTSASRWARILIVGACAGVGACSGPTSPGENSVVTINIVGSNGTQAYTPNPAQVSTGAIMELRNYTTVSHHIVMNDGSADFGDIAPGGSGTRRLTTNGGDYHCTIHQTMVGNINGRLPTEPRPCDPAFYDLSHCCDGYYC
jgi:plastocyanin